MLRWMITSGQRVRLLVVTAAVAVMILGAWQIPRVPKEILPEFGPVYVEVQTEALGLSATEVEDLITVPLEQNLLNGVAWLDEIHSESITGLSSIVLVFEPGTNELRARQMVAERLTQAFALPDVSKPPQMLQPLSSSSRVVMVALSSEELSQMQTSLVARWTIRPALMGVPGVANVSIWGHREQQLQVQVDPVRLAENNVVLDDVIATTGNALWVSPLTFLEASAPGTGGFIDTPNQRLGVQHLLPINSPEDLALVPVEGCDQQYAAQNVQGPVPCPTLGDVATIVEQHQPLIGDSMTGQEKDILLVIERFPDASTEQVVGDVRAKLEEMRPGLGDITFDTTLFQRDSFIETAMDNLVQLLVFGIVLAVVVIALFLFDWRSAVIALITIPLSLTAAALVLHYSGAPFNIIILSGLIVALAVVIDDVVVDAENIRRRMREMREAGDERPASAMVVEAVLEMRRPIVAATVIVLLAAAPLMFMGGLFDSFFIGGESRAFFEPMVIGYVFAVAVSLAVSLIITPTLAAIFYARYTAPRRESPIVHGIRTRYTEVLNRLTPQAAVAGALAAVMLIAGMAILPQLSEPENILADSRDRDLLVTWEAATGTSLPEMDRVTSRLTEELRSVDGVRNVSAHVGRAITSDQVVDVHSGEIWVSVDPAANYDKTVDEVGSIVNGYPGIDHEVHTYLEDSIAQVATTSDSVVVRVYGQGMDELQASATRVQEAMEGIDGITGTQIVLPEQKAQIEVEVDLAKAQGYGLKPGEVRRTAATLVTGLEVGSLFEDQKVFEVMVVGVPETRHSVQTVQNMLIDTPDGSQVRLGDVARVELVPALDTVTHEAVSRFVDVIATVGDRDRNSVADELNARLEAVDFPLEYHAEVLGGFEEQEEAEQGLIRAFLVTVVLSYLVLQAIFTSWRLATLAFLSLPVAVVGSVVMMWLMGGDVSLGALLGLLVVLGIAVRNSVVLISRCEDLHAEGTQKDVNRVNQAAQERIIPILTSAVATVLAFVPYAVMGSEPGLELAHPMALVVIGGIVTTVIVSLFILPSLYLWIAPVSRPATSSTGEFDLPAHSQPAD